MTLTSLDLFHFGRWQAWAWIVLFGAFPVAASVALWWGRPVPRRRPPITAVLYGIVTVVAAALLWWAPR